MRRKAVLYLMLIGIVAGFVPDAKATCNSCWEKKPVAGKWVAGCCTSPECDANFKNAGYSKKYTNYTTCKIVPDGSGGRRCQVTGGPFCSISSGECISSSDCEDLYGDLEFGTYTCQEGECLVLNSPLMLHLPDYSTGGGGQNWWKEGLCGPEVPTVCLDWRGNGVVTCTGWTEPGSEIAYVVALSDDDMDHLSDGLYVPAEPWRHFFGNITMGPEGDFPFAHGFEALAAHCGQDPGANSEIDLTECGLSLHVWDDGSGDGNIDPEELLELQDLGIESLGDVRKTGKKDKCGNTFPAESHATCFGHPGRCGTWLDVFFESR